jgi:hypothetical protein
MRIPTEYRKTLDDTIDNINSLRKIVGSGNRNENVKNVAVILCGSRNGSSLLKTMVSKSPDLAYLAGEEEPYFILSKNGFPFNSDSDEINQIINKQHLLDCIFDEMGVNINGKKPSIKQIQKDWWNRMLLQTPYSPIFFRSLIDIFNEEIFNYMFENDEFNWNEINQLFLKKFFKGQQAFGYYDIIPENTPFMSEGVDRFKIEETPYVIPTWKRQITDDDFEDKVLFFKTPQDCYRIGIFEELFPNANIKYIHLSRGFAQSVNGLMDGWLSETGFFAHNMESIGERLNIKGYTDKVEGGDRWWNFDLPPNWRSYQNASLEEVCLNQWYEAHNTILESGIETLRIKFEDFLQDGQATLNKITTYLNINPIKVKKLPVIMATEAPSSFRWHKRKQIFLEMAKTTKVISMMTKLGYTMDPETWE